MRFHRVALSIAVRSIPSNFLQSHAQNIELTAQNDEQINHVHFHADQRVALYDHSGHLIRIDQPIDFRIVVPIERIPAQIRQSGLVQKEWHRIGHDAGHHHQADIGEQHFGQ